MNKAVHALVYVILAVAAVALYFEMKLFEKKDLLKESNRQLRECIVRLSKTIEKEDAQKPGMPPEARKDVSPIEAKLLDSPDMENVLEDYPAQLENSNPDNRLKWGDAQSTQLRKFYAEDAEGNRQADPANPGAFVTKGPGTAQELIDLIVARADEQVNKLNTTRAALTDSRTKIENLVTEFNKLKSDSRQDKITIEEQKASIADLEQKKAAVEEQLTKTKSQVDELEGDVKSLREEVTSAKEKTEAVEQDLAKSQKLVDQLKKLLQTQSARPQTASTVPAGSLTAGNKGRVIYADNKLMFALVEFDETAIQELLGADRGNALPLLEMGLRRTGFKGSAGEYIGRVRLRTAVAGKNYVIADILSDWQQAPIQKGDLVFAE